MVCFFLKIFFCGCGIFTETRFMARANGILGRQKVPSAPNMELREANAFSFFVNAIFLLNTYFGQHFHFFVEFVHGNCHVFFNFVD